jgi:acetyltransferase-like isoleucine patch superfamily enzyme
VMIRRLFNIYLKYFRPVAYARLIGVKVGQDCRLLRCDYSTEPYLINIGNHVSATKTRFETHDGAVWVLRARFPEIDLIKCIHIEDNVYIGYGATILPGVRIGANSIVGAGSIVTKDIPPNSVAVGVPARVIKTVDDYAKKAVATGDPTKFLSPEKKRQFYISKYKGSLYGEDQELSS